MALKAVRPDVSPTCYSCSSPLDGSPSRQIDIKQLFDAARAFDPARPLCQLCQERISVINQERSLDEKETYFKVSNQIINCVAVILTLIAATGVLFFPTHK
jgi:hypothetical protein